MRKLVMFLSVLVLLGMQLTTSAQSVVAGSECPPGKDISACFLEVGKEPVKGERMAPLCSGNGCNGKDPYAMRCNVSYGVVAVCSIYDNRGNNIGYTQLWWSNTCQTNWARTVRIGSARSFPYVMAQVIRDDNRNRRIDPSDLGYFKWGWESDQHTGMVYAPTTSALAGGFLDTDAMYVFSCQTAWK